VTNRALVRQAGLLVVAFVATLVLLAGGWALFSQGGGRAGGSLPSTGAVTPSAVAIASASPGLGASPSASEAASPLAPSASAATGSSEPPSQPPDVVVTGAGDIASCGLRGDSETSDLLVDQPGRIFTAGDNAYEDGSTANFEACYAPTWGRVLDRTTLPAPGNHDWNTPGAAGYLAYFGAAAAPNGTTWYSTDLGAWHVIVLDSDCEQVGGCVAGSPQGRWLADDLAAHADTRCTLAIWHHPRFSSGEHGNDPRTGPFWDQLVAAHADLVINGHDHDYERFAPQNAAGKEDRKNGLREIVVGTGGASLRTFPGVVANSEIRLAGEWGVIRLTLHVANYDWEFLPVTKGAITDYGSALCH
jgi:3',5'-cyclic AMP phosphodiesterase CpdA